MIKPHLFNHAPQRLFTFGCSFTGFKYPTWAEVLAYELDIPFYNYGRSGAGNSYMFNMLMQADNYFNFNPNDLIIICWTNLAREDRFSNGAWHTPGNIYTQRTYSAEWVREWADLEGFALRDAALIKAADEFLSKRQVQYHFLSMLNLLERINQWKPTKDDARLIEIKKNYCQYFDRILPSFYQVLWNNDIEHKLAEEHKIHPKLRNGHPTPAEHLAYLTQVFEHQFKPETKAVVAQADQDYQNIVSNYIKRTSFDFMDFSPCWFTCSNTVPSLLTKP
jgi:hypothetical protein